MSSSGKVALVTGGGSGIGKAAAVALAKEGFAAVIAGRRPDRLEEVAREIEGAGVARDRLFSSPLALPDGLPVLWRDAGLTAVERGSITIRMEYADFADYWEPLLGGQGPVGAYVEGLPPERRRLIEERVRAAFLSGAPDGPRSLTATAWAVRGIIP